MANKSLFKSTPKGRLVPPTDAVNSAGGVAYAQPAEEALAQLAVTGCFGDTYYATAEAQLQDVLSLAAQVRPDFLAKLAVYSREKGLMKDMPAMLMACLAARMKTANPIGQSEVSALFERAFPRAINNGKMIRNFVQIIRSGVTGRKSLGSLPKRLIADWLMKQTHPSELIFQSTGADPSMGDVIKMVWGGKIPKIEVDPMYSATLAYLAGNKYQRDHLPEPLVQLEDLRKVVDKGLDRRAIDTSSLPDVPMLWLTQLPLTTVMWKGLALRCSWNELRQNLSAFSQHGVFDDKQIVSMLEKKMRDRARIEKAKVFPYQIMTTYLALTGGVERYNKTRDDSQIPKAILSALQDALDIAVENVPTIPGRVFVCVDVSGSMTSATITGSRKGATSVVKAVDVAGLIAAAVVKKNPEAVIITVDTEARVSHFNERDSVITIGRSINRSGGGTNLSAALDLIHLKFGAGGVDSVIFVSDYESWMDSTSQSYSGNLLYGTAMARSWETVRHNNPKARMVCIDLVPNRTHQMPTGRSARPEVLNIGGFSDTVFEVMARFLAGDKTSATKLVDALEL